MSEAFSRGQFSQPFNCIQREAENGRTRSAPYLFGLHVTQMPTAIVGAYTPEGFILAADGRSCRSEDGTIISDLTQKIFYLERPGAVLMYAMMGNINIHRFRG